MGHNLFICYLLDKKTDQEKVDRAIASLGNSTPIFQGLWYVNGMEDAKEALKRVSSWMTTKDRLVIVDAASNECLWFNMDEKMAQRIRQNWRMDISKNTNKAKPATTTH